MINYLDKLCRLDAPSGNEKSVRNYLLNVISPSAECFVDPLGNIIGEKKGRKTPAHKIMLAAHMDEVGLIVTHICEDGTLKFSCVGGILSQALTGIRVRAGGVCGVIGTKAVHRLSPEEKKKMPDADELFIDIGAMSHNEAEELVALGDCFCFVTEPQTLSDSRFLAKAVDDRVGCAILLGLILDGSEYDFSFAFTVQEEVGARGAKAAAYTVAPDYAIVLEATTAADIPGTDCEKKVCELGNGAAAAYMDRSTAYCRELVEAALRLSRELKIPCQLKSMVAGGNDSGSIHLSRSGVRTLALSVPCRYLHSPSCMIDLRDMDAVYRLSMAMISEIGDGHAV